MRTVPASRGAAHPQPRSESPGPWQIAARRLAYDRAALTALGVLVVLALISVVAPAVSSCEPNTQADIITSKNLPPSPAHWFGTDKVSRDVLCRVLYGSRVSLAVAFSSVVLSSMLGAAYGSVAGMAGERVDALLMRVVDALVSVPRFLVLLAVLSLWGSVRVSALVLLIGATGWFATSRMVRAQVRSVRRREFVVAASALGASRTRVLARHVLPNVLSPIVVSAAVGVGHVIGLEAALAYLGIGLPLPSPSWGNIILEGAGQLADHWWLSVFPGLAIVITVMAVNRLGDGLRDALDPRQLPEP